MFFNAIFLKTLCKKDPVDWRNLIHVLMKRELLARLTAIHHHLLGVLGQKIDKSPSFNISEVVR